MQPQVRLQALLLDFLGGTLGLVGFNLDAVTSDGPTVGELDDELTQAGINDLAIALIASTAVAIASIINNANELIFDLNQKIIQIA